MFNNISWSDYIAFLTLVLIVYYLFIGIKFYSFELKQLLAGKIKLSFRGVHKNYSCHKSEEITNSEPLEIDRKSFREEEQTDNLSQKAEEITSKLIDAISHAVSKNYNKEEFSFMLQLTLKDYQALKGSPFQVAINNLIASEIDKHSFIRLSAVELGMLWNKVV